jgi:metal-dependent amidase/aminoacylase/carboxypeptidase family protein
MKSQFLLSLTLATIFVFEQNVCCQQFPKETLIQESIKIETDKIFDKIVKLRRQIHQSPELAGNEVNTQKVIKQYVLDLGLEVLPNVYGNSVVAVLKGAKKGKSIAWRADMDALPNDFPDNVDFKSITKNVQHGCGHDVHMAIALGIAEVLSKHKKDLNGTVYFIFQPEEETFKGAKGMIDNKLFSKIKPTEMYGCHVTPFSVGQIMVKPNEMYAYQKGVRIEFKNNLPKERLIEIYQKISNTLTRTINNRKPWELHYALDPNVGLANSNTIFKDYFLTDGHFVDYSKNDSQFLEFDVYETNKDKLKDIIPAIKKVIEIHDLDLKLVSVTYFKENPTIDNDPKLTNIAINTLDKLYGKGTITIDYGQIPFSNDDFSYFQEKVPGVYFYLGGSNFEKNMIAMIHAPNFMVDEECIRNGVSAFSTLILSRLYDK